MLSLLQWQRYSVIRDNRKIENTMKRFWKEEAMKEGLKEGLKEGREKGIKEGIKETAKRLKEDGIPIENIIKYTNLSKEEIENL